MHQEQKNLIRQIEDSNRVQFKERRQQSIQNVRDYSS